MRGESGFTLVEMLIAAAFLAFAGLVIAVLLSKPVAVQRQMTLADARLPVEQAMERFANDLRQADPSSIDYTSISPNNPGVVFSSFSFTLSSTTFLAVGGSTTTFTAVQYSYQAGPTLNVGSLVRSENGVVQSPPLLNNVQAPTASFPLVQCDTTTLTPVLMLAVSYAPPGISSMTATRRVAMSGFPCS